METYQMMRIGFYVCLAVAALFFLVSVILFFRFDIRSILSEKNDQKKAKIIREMLEENRKTGRFPRRKTKVRRKKVSKRTNIKTDDLRTSEDNAADRSAYDSPTVRLDEVDSALLVQSATIPEVEGVRFDIVRKIVCRATEEIIE